MAFAGMFFVAIFIAIFAGFIFFTFLFLILSFTFRKKGKKKTSTVMLVLGIICGIPVMVVAGYFIHSRIYNEVILPDGSKKVVLENDVGRMWELVNENSEESVALLSELLDKNPDLVYYRDANKNNLLDYGLELGNYKTVELAIKYGASFDDPSRYEYMAYSKCSMEEYLDAICYRSLTEDDIKILKKLTQEAMVDYVNKNPLVYSNAFGQAVWAVLYNDENVTDLEIEFLEVLACHGIDSDDYFLLYEELGNNVFYSDREYYETVKKDGNYEKVLKMIGK